MARKPRWKIEALKKAREDIYVVMDRGYDVLMCTDYHWKIDGVDVYPSCLKYMKNKIAQRYDSLLELFAEIE